MIVNPAGMVAVSSQRWACPDGGTVWTYALADPEPRQVSLSKAEWLSLVQGSEEYFAVVHHFEDGRVYLTAHSYQNIGQTISSIEVDRGSPALADASNIMPSRFSGETSVWTTLPGVYVIDAPDGPFLALIDWRQKTVQIQVLSWYRESYDTLYQGILGLTEVPGSTLLIFSFQRDSEPVIYDPSTRKILRKINLGGNTGAPQLYFRSKAHELWASDYDTMVRLDSRNWGMLDTLKLQVGEGGMVRSNIGKYYFCRDESLCVVARPHSEDVVGIDPITFTITLRAETGGQPEDVGLFRDNRVVARDLKTGRLLQGVLQPV